MKSSVVQAFKAHARACYPNEACGFIVAINGREKYYACKNVHSSPSTAFAIPHTDYVAAEEQGEILAILHSHPDGSALPSEVDKMQCEASGLPWYILAVGAQEFGGMERISPSGYVPPLIGREFVHGVLDCYTLVRDYYLREKGITLPDYHRDDNWWNEGKDLYEDNFRDAGFTPLDTAEGEQLSEGDVILMQMRSPVVNHAGIFLGEGTLKEAPDAFKIPNAMLHHLHGRLSERTVYGGQYAEITRRIIRYRNGTVTDN